MLKTLARTDQENTAPVSSNGSQSNFDQSTSLPSMMTGEFDGLAKGEMYMSNETDMTEMFM